MPSTNYSLDVGLSREYKQPSVLDEGPANVQLAEVSDLSHVVVIEVLNMPSSHGIQTAPTCVLTMVLILVVCPREAAQNTPVGTPALPAAGSANTCPCAQASARPKKKKPQDVCDVEAAKEECGRKLDANRELAIGLFFLKRPGPQPALYEDDPKRNEVQAYLHCEAALKLNPYSTEARTCVDDAVVQLRPEYERRTELLLRMIDSDLWSLDPDRAAQTIKQVSLQTPETGPAEGEKKPILAALRNRLFYVNVLRLLYKIPLILLTMTEIAGGLFFLYFAGRGLFFVLGVLAKRLRYRAWTASSSLVQWKVWGIVDQASTSNGGPLMDALNSANNPLLQAEFRPSSLLFVPSLSTPGRADEVALEVWRDFLDSPRAPMDLEVLPIPEFAKHRFVQTEAFDELNLKLGGFEAQGLVGLFRNVRRWLERGLPAAQGFIYKIDRRSSPDGKPYVCVRLTCNWDTKRATFVKAVASPGQTVASDSSPEVGLGETISVFASSEDDPAIDAVALSSQRAAFKLFYRLASKRPPTYVTAAAGFHQGVLLLDQYL